MRHLRIHTVASSQQSNLRRWFRFDRMNFIVGRSAGNRLGIAPLKTKTPPERG
jgi:hypothetical protein